MTTLRQQRQDGDREYVNIPTATRQRNGYDAVTHVELSGRTKLRTHDWDSDLVVGDENTVVF